ncbi:penicillin-binding protein activator [Candidatus Thiosymbion oneisti]|uniref:penicillin-binding protein activator n=1 Tax=Candidatus Thiosymbion oneisti TaxID=589554 RepID=UPI00105F77BC|nr:penicillin-binding protein activator [Candidatus Thiosymbion oneisti]
MNTHALRYWIIVVVALSVLSAGCSKVKEWTRQQHKDGDRIDGLQYQDGDRVGVLLPTGNDKYREPALAIMAGIEDARKDSNIKTKIIIEKSRSNVEEQYRSLAAQKPKVIIGPLLPDNVDKVAGKIGLVPTLLLNKTDINGKFYQFALSPKDEAATVAQLFSGVAKNPIVVYPERPGWETRLAKKFESEFKSKFGRTKSTKVRKVKYDDKRRIVPSLQYIKEADAVFLIADADNAPHIYKRLLKKVPENTPIVATSHVTDKKQGSYDPELKDLYFVETPWLLDEKMREAFKGEKTRKYSSGDLARLYAMGIDAYHLGPGVVAGKSPVRLKDGKTGNIELRKGSIKRRLAFGRFKKKGKRVGPVRVRSEKLEEAIR